MFTEFYSIGIVWRYWDTSLRTIYFQFYRVWVFYSVLQWFYIVLHSVFYKLCFTVFLNCLTYCVLQYFYSVLHSVGVLQCFYILSFTVFLLCLYSVLQCFIVISLCFTYCVLLCFYSFYHTVFNSVVTFPVCTLFVFTLYLHFKAFYILCL